MLHEYTMNKIENTGALRAEVAEQGDGYPAADERQRSGQAELRRTPLTRWRAGGAGGCPGNVNLIRHVCSLAKGDA